MEIQDPKLDYLPRYPDNAQDYGIGVIGPGYIVEIAHAPAYQQAGFEVVAAADLSADRREFCRQTFPQAQVFEDYRALLDLPEVKIVDVALPQTLPAKVEIIHAAIAAGKHLLVQKPFWREYSVAHAMVAHAREAGVKLMINQQGRWAPAYRAIKQLLDQGYVGDPFWLTFDDRRHYDWPGTNYVVMPEILLWMTVIHFIDLVRWWLGKEPQKVIYFKSRRPNQHATGDMVGTLILDFGDELTATFMENDASFAQSVYHRFRVEGTQGLIEGEYDDLWSPGSFRYSPAEPEDYWFTPRLEGTWIPGAFIGSMGELMLAINEEREPLTSGADNLKTLQIICAAYRSAELERAVAPSEIKP